MSCDETYRWEESVNMNVIADETRELLEALAPVLQAVDSNCSYCVQAAVDGANEVLTRMGIAGRYVTIKHEHYDEVRFEL